MNDTVVLVTGGAGNLGREVTRAFLDGGARVAVPVYKTDVTGALDDLPPPQQDRLHTFSLDLTTERGAMQAVQQVVEWAGRLDVVVHLMGGYLGGSRVADTPVEAWDRMMELNLKSAWLISHHAIPRMVEQKGGTLLFVSSRSAREGRAGHVGYAVAKAGLLTLAEGIAEEYAADGIRANAILPGTMDTEGNRQTIPGGDRSKWVAPEEVARVLLFLASPDAAAVNGASIPVYGRG